MLDRFYDGRSHQCKVCTAFSTWPKKAETTQITSFSSSFLFFFQAKMVATLTLKMSRMQEKISLTQIGIVIYKALSFSANLPRVWFIVLKI